MEQKKRVRMTNPKESIKDTVLKSYGYFWHYRLQDKSLITQNRFSNWNDHGGERTTLISSCQNYSKQYENV